MNAGYLSYSESNVIGYETQHLMVPKNEPVDEKVSAEINNAIVGKLHDKAVSIYLESVRVGSSCYPDQKCHVYSELMAIADSLSFAISAEKRLSDAKLPARKTLSEITDMKNNLTITMQALQLLHKPSHLSTEQNTAMLICLNASLPGSMPFTLLKFICEFIPCAEMTFVDARRRIVFEAVEVDIPNIFATYVDVRNSELDMKKTAVDMLRLYRKSFISNRSDKKQVSKQKVEKYVFEDIEFLAKLDEKSKNGNKFQDGIVRSIHELQMFGDFVRLPIAIKNESASESNMRVVEFLKERISIAKQFQKTDAEAKDMMREQIGVIAKEVIRRMNEYMIQEEKVTKENCNKIGKIANKKMRSDKFGTTDLSVSWQDSPLRVCAQTLANTKTRFEIKENEVKACLKYLRDNKYRYEILGDYAQRLVDAIDGKIAIPTKQVRLEIVKLEHPSESNSRVIHEINCRGAPPKSSKSMEKRTDPRLVQQIDYLTKDRNKKIKTKK